MVGLRTLLACAAMFLTPEASSRKLLIVPATPSSPFHQNAAWLFKELLLAVNASEAVINSLNYAALQSVVFTEEAIVIADQAISLIEAFDAPTNLTTVVPGSVSFDAAVGTVLIVGVSALFNIEPSSVLNATYPVLNVGIPLSSARALANLPGLFEDGGLRSPGAGVGQRVARRSLLGRAADALGAAKRRRRDSATTPVSKPSTAVAPIARRSLSSDSASRLLPSLRALLPAGVAAKLTAFLQSHDFTLQAPSLATPIATIPVVPQIDFELSLRLLAISNEQAASVRIGPTLRFAGDGTISAGFLVNPFFSTFRAVNLKQLEGFAAGALNTTAKKLEGNTVAAREAASAEVAALQSFFQLQNSVFPLQAAIEFDVLIRPQLTLNGGDIAEVV